MMRRSAASSNVVSAVYCLLALLICGTSRVESQVLCTDPQCLRGFCSFGGTCTRCGGGFYLGSNTCDACSTAASCLTEQYQSAGCSITNDRICTRCSCPCAWNTYESTACTSTTNRVCTACSGACPSGFYQSAACTPTSDRVCTEYPTLTSSQIGGIVAAATLIPLVAILFAVLACRRYRPPAEWYTFRTFWFGKLGNLDLEVVP